MTWTKTSDDFSDDCWALSDAAYRLHHEGLTWSNRKLLDCVIPTDDLPRFTKRVSVVPELLARGFWRDAGDDYVIVHHSAYQRSAADVIAAQERSRSNGKKGGRPPKPVREVWSETQTGSHVGSTETQAGTQNGTQRDRTGQDRALEVEGSHEWCLDTACPQCQTPVTRQNGAYSR
jgi:hypothetical protein